MIDDRAAGARVFCIDDPDVDWEDLKMDWEHERAVRTGDYFWVLCAVDAEGRAVQALGWDGGEPEDQLLVRDWSWVEGLVDFLIRSRT